MDGLGTGLVAMGVILAAAPMARRPSDAQEDDSDAAGDGAARSDAEAASDEPKRS